MSSSTNFGKCNERVLGRLSAVCSADSAMRSDEELRASFDSFLAGEQVKSNIAEQLKSSDYFAIVEEIIDVLHELQEQLIAKGGKSQPEENSQVDSSNRLYASLKRHPE